MKVSMIDLQDLALEVTWEDLDSSSKKAVAVVVPGVGVEVPMEGEEEEATRQLDSTMGECVVYACTVCVCE